MYSIVHKLLIKDITLRLILLQMTIVITKTVLLYTTEFEKLFNRQM